MVTNEELIAALREARQLTGYCWSVEWWNNKIDALLARADEPQAEPTMSQFASREDYKVDEAALNSAHKVMTEEEYINVELQGWHCVYKNIDGFGAYGIRYDAPPPPDAGAEPVAWMLMPVDAIRWLMGEGGSFECPPEKYFRGKPAPFWWRSVFADKIAAAPEPPKEG